MLLGFKQPHQFCFIIIIYLSEREFTGSGRGAPVHDSAANPITTQAVLAEPSLSHQCSSLFGLQHSSSSFNKLQQ
jgi:hypothetical protein